MDLPEGRIVGRRRLWTVLDKMIIIDMMKTLAAVLFVIVIILVSRKFIDILGMAIEGKISNETVFTMVGLKSLGVAIKFLPDAVFISILLVLGRMYRDHEMDALASAGVGPGSHYWSIFLLLGPLSVCAFGLSFYTAPWAEATIEKLKFQDKQSMDIRGISAGKFSEYSRGDLVFYIESIDKGKRMHNIFVQNREYGKLGVINAETGRIKELPEGRYIVLENGERIQGQPGRADLVIEKFDEYAVLFEQEKKNLNYKTQAIPSEKLWGTKNLHDIAELQSRFSIPLGLLVLAALAIPLAQLSPRDGFYSNIVVAFLIDFSYANLLRFSQGLLINQTIPVWLSSISVYLLMSAVLVFLVVRLLGREWVILQLKGGTAH
ncbi:MAG: LPS export ABC transporter permease LptF [Gammaproteobacteria bacterium]